MNADELALLRGVEAAPDDDLPRLVYADWLDEHGRHARAEFIRIQCRIAVIDRELAALDYEQRAPYEGRRHCLAEDAYQLHQAEPTETLGLPTDGWPAEEGDAAVIESCLYDYFKRGFISRVSVYPMDYKSLDDLVKLLARLIPRPYIEIVVSDYMYGPEILHTDQGEALLSQHELWAEVNEIEMSGEYASPPALEDFAKLVRPAYPALRVMKFNDIGLDAEYVRVIAERLNAPNLERLDLSENRFGDEVFGHLRLAVFAKTLKTLDLYLNRITLARDDTFSLHWFPALTRLKVIACEVTPETVERLKSQRPGVEIETEYDYGTPIEAIEMEYRDGDDIPF